MKGKDSYPPAETKSNIKSVNVIGLSENDEDEKSPSEIDGDGEDARGNGDWDGSEAEIVVDDEAEEYEDETTGIKIKYTLKPEEIKSFIRHSESYKKNKKAQKKHTVVQSIIFICMVALGIATGSIVYTCLAVFPILALVITWLMPFFSIKSLVRDLFRNEEIEVEIFPERIEVNGKNQSREILLDDSCESEELEDMIVIFSKKILSLIVPLRAVEPEFQADVQAMIFAGAKPRYKG